MLDVDNVVTNLASSRPALRQGHIGHVKIVASHLTKFKWDTIRIMTKEPDLSAVLTTPCDWETLVSGNVSELSTHVVPTLLVNDASTISFYDANEKQFHN